MITILQIWNWLNGRKTLIGAAILLLVKFLNEVVVMKAHYNPQWLEITIYALDWIGNSLTSFGFMHKLSKYVQQPLKQEDTSK